MVIDQFIQQTLVSCLSKSGLAYLLVIEQNNPKDIAQEVSELFGFHCTPVISRKCGIERLTVLRFQRIIENKIPKI